MEVLIFVGILVVIFLVRRFFFPRKPTFQDLTSEWSQKASELQLRTKLLEQAKKTRNKELGDLAKDERISYKKLERIAAKNNKSEDTEPGHSKEDLFNLGKQALSNKEFSKAYRFFYIIRNDKKYSNPLFYQVMAECLLDNDDFNLVEKILSEGITKYPNDSHLHYMRGMNRGNLENLDGKIEDLNNALKNFKAYSVNKIYNKNIEDEWYHSVEELYMAELKVAELVKKKID